MFEAKRAEYERYSPVLWRPAEGARAADEPFLKMLVEQDGPVALVADGGNAGGPVDAAILALPRADDWLVDDFAVARSEQWADAGARLLVAVRARVAD